MGLHINLLGQFHGQIVKRGAEYLGAATVSTEQSRIERLQHNAQLYENSSVEDVGLAEVSVLILTVAFFFILYASVKYTLGNVVASLAMIEQPSTVIVSEYRPLNKADAHPDAPLEKEDVLDEEIIIMKEQPITSSIKATIRHLVSVGGYAARWRGLAISTVYHALQGILAQVVTVLFGMLPISAPFAFVLGSIASSVLLARIHMTWTHIMISSPSPLAWYRRVPKGRTYFKALFTPALIFAIAEHLTVILPLMVYFSFGAIENIEKLDVHREALRIVSTIGTAGFVALALLLPASVTLTRVEASLLPDDVETIVNFDRTLGGAAANLVGFGKINFRALYDAAWRSFDKASRIRLIKFYVKYFAILCAIWVLAATALTTEISFMGLERMVVFTKSGSAQLQLAAMGVPQD